VSVEQLDLGDGHVLHWTCWAPDRELNPQYEGLPDVERFGAFITNPTADGGTCTSAITFDTPQARQLVPERALWQVESWEPLTVSPSLLCPDCGDHGFIREGRWVRA